MMGFLTETSVLLSAFILLLQFPHVEANAYYSSWYVYVIIVFLVIAISSCIGACVRHRRQQQFLAQHASVSAVTVNFPANPQGGIGYPNGAYTGYTNGGQYPVSPAGPPQYTSQVSKDALPPSYDEVAGDAYTPQPYPTQPPAPYPTQAPAPYPTQAPAPYPTQAPAPYPTQAPAPYPMQEPAPYPAQSGGDRTASSQ